MRKDMDFGISWRKGECLMNIIFKKSETREKKWHESFWFSSSLQPKQKQLVLTFYGESQVLDGCNFTNPGIRDYYCIEYVEQGQGILIDEDNIRHTLSPGKLYILYSEGECKIQVPPGQRFSKIMLGIANGALLQTMLYRSQIGSGDIISLKSDSEVIQQFRKIGELTKKGMVPEEELSTECYRFLLRLAAAQRSKPVISLQSICEYIQNNLQKAITLDDIAKTAGMSKVTLIRKFRKEFSCTPIQYLISLRLDYAQNLLHLQHMSVKEAAYLCGYRNVKFFSREYRRRFKIPPSQSMK